jgi:ABC-2 type transport system ATP-binding protein
MDCWKKAPVIASRIGYMPATIFQHDSMTIQSLLQYALSFYKGVSEERMLELAQRLELDRTRRIETLSLSEKKRVALVQALAHEPDIVILDEPTKGIDSRAQILIREIVREENKRGATILFSSHALSEVQLSCDRIAIMGRGRLLEVRDTATVVTHYKKIRLVAKKPLDITVLSSFTQRCAAGLGTVIVPDGSIDVIPFNNGVSNLAVDGVNASFTFRGDLNALVSALDSFGLEDLAIEEPTLDEVFFDWTDGKQ